MILVMFLVFCILTILFFLWSMWAYWKFRKDFLFNREKASAFECGFDGKKSFRTSFSFRFFYILIIFLIFDIELALLMGLPVFKGLNMFLLLIIQTLVFMLSMGLLYEWYKKALNWKI